MPTNAARKAANRYLRQRLGQRPGFRQVLEYLLENDFSKYREVIVELAEDMDDFRNRRKGTTQEEK